MKSLFFDKQRLDSMSKLERKNYTYRLKLVKAIVENNGMTNSEIRDELNISTPKLLTLINKLVAEDILEQKEKGNSIGGRKPVLNKIKDSTLLILCVEVERFKVKISVVDNNNNVKNPTIYPFLLTKNQSSIGDLNQLISAFVDSHAIDWAAILGIGISMPGLIHDKAGNNYTYMIGQQGDTPLNELFSAHFNKPVVIINDVKSVATAELKFGLAKERKDVLVILMDWGIGLGIIMDGQLQGGTAGFSGEIGHIPFVEDGMLCYCGKRGCLETVASGIALARMAKEGIQSGQDSLLNELSDREIENIEPHLIINAAKRGDQYAISILSYLGEKLGKGMATLIQLFNPELIVLGGKIAEAKEYITIPIQKAINTYCMQPIRDLVHIELSQFGSEAGAIGTAHIFLDELFDMHINHVNQK
ncbi:ROK family transcriptional regulator [Parapedobacter sp. DT-150]|uniref:ROK family transcriptional regulator n=1 Tax=Parapedobacter sp. DT-150 TaxID=3396162 RepID=UPI003F1C5A39